MGGAVPRPTDERRTGDMDVLRVFNNNVVLARDAEGREVVLTGRGLGFQAKPGDPVDDDRVVRVFVPDDGRSADNFAAAVAAIAPSTSAPRTPPCCPSGRRAGCGPPRRPCSPWPTTSASRSRGSGRASAWSTRCGTSFVRVHTDAQLDDRADLFASAIRGAYPDAYRTARRVREILELRLGQPVTEDETVYLTMHVARLAQASRPRRPDAKE